MFANNYLFHKSNQSILASMVFFVTLSSLHGKKAIAVMSAVALFVASFFRGDCIPRIVEEASANPRVFHAPCYGKVTHISQRDNKTVVSVFLSLFDKHFQHIPCYSLIKDTEFIPGKFEFAQLYEKTANNARMIYKMFSPVFGSYEIHQVAGFIARAIVPFVKRGMICEAGEELGMIRFGSRIDIILPSTHRVLVHVGDRVHGPETALAIASQ